MYQSPTDLSNRSARVETSPSRRSWGGFVLATGNGGALHVKLTGMFSAATATELDLAVRRASRGNATVFVLLHAGALTHVSLPAAHSLLQHEQQWRQWGAVTAWVAPSAYVTQLLRLAAGADGLPILPDLATAQRLAAELAGSPAGVARDRLEVLSAPAH